MTLEEIKNYIIEMQDDEDSETIVLENPDYSDAFLGLSDEGRAIYDYNKMIESLMKEDGMDYVDAVEFFEYNTLRALPYMGELRPIILYSTESDL